MESTRRSLLAMAEHVPVLLESVFEVLSLRPGETYVDCTAGLGGHAMVAAERVGPTGTVVLNDWDAENLRRAGEALSGRCRVDLVHGNFAELPRTMAERGLLADAVLADLGFASVHVDDGERGFSFMRDGPLDMRYDPSGRQSSASVLVNTLPQSELVSILREFGEEPRAKAVAQKLVQARSERPIETTGELASLVRSVVPRSYSAGGRGIDPATRTFQALRIAVNDEIGSLAALLASVQHDAAGWLRTGARIGIISFHSLEDRLVKQAYTALVDSGKAELVGRKPVVADEAEVDRNPRSRSAKLRVIRMVESGRDGRAI